jgi:transposase-like protein
MSLRKVTKNRGHFPNDEAMFKLIYLALKNIANKMVNADQRLEVCSESV